MSQIREEVSFTKGRIIVRGKLVSRGKAKRADYVLYYKPNIPLALIEAKDNSYGVGDGMQQGLDYATTLQIPFVFSSNGDGFVFHDRTGSGGTTETNLSLDTFPPPAELWGRYRAWKSLTDEAEQIVLQDYFDDGSGKGPRYYQVNAVNAAIEAIAKGHNRILLVMATGTGKTYTAFQILWRLWKAGRKKRRRRATWQLHRSGIEIPRACHHLAPSLYGCRCADLPLDRARPPGWLNDQVQANRGPRHAGSRGHL
jgi:type I restriction enzyme, R subunit